MSEERPCSSCCEPCGPLDLEGCQCVCTDLVEGTSVSIITRGGIYVQGTVTYIRQCCRVRINATIVAFGERALPIATGTTIPITLCCDEIALFTSPALTPVANCPCP